MMETINGKAYIKKGDKVYEVGGGGGATSWNDLTDKPFGDESVTIEWDGLDVEGRVAASGFATGYNAIKVSDLTPETEELIGGVIRAGTYGSEHESITLTTDAINDIRSEGFNLLMIGDQMLFVVYEDALNLGDIVFPEKGIYFIAIISGETQKYTSSLTYGSLKKLDPKYLPDDIGGSGLPPVTEADNGKFLQVVDGAIALVALQDVSKEGA